MKKLFFGLVISVSGIVLSQKVVAQNSFISYRTFSKKLDNDLKNTNEQARKQHLMALILQADFKIKENEKDILAKQNMVYAYNYLRQSMGLKTAPSFYEINQTWITEQTSSGAHEQTTLVTPQSSEEVLPEIHETKGNVWLIPGVVTIASALVLGSAALCCMGPRKKVKQGQRLLNTLVIKSNTARIAKNGIINGRKTNPKNKTYMRIAAITAPVPVNSVKKMLAQSKLTVKRTVITRPRSAATNPPSNKNIQILL